jgi:hypothetical protein
MEYKNGWYTYYSKTLGQKYACKILPDGTLDTWTEDKVHYSQKEIDIIKKNHGEFDNRVHILKKFFFGEIIQ